MFWTSTMGFAKGSTHPTNCNFVQRIPSRRLSAFVRAAAGVIQPFPGLFVGPTGKSETRWRRNTLAGGDNNTAVCVRRWFEATHRRGVGGSAASDQQAQDQ